MTANRQAEVHPRLSGQSCPLIGEQDTMEASDWLRGAMSKVSCAVNRKDSGAGAEWQLGNCCELHTK